MYIFSITSGSGVGALSYVVLITGGGVLSLYTLRVWVGTLPSSWPQRKYEWLLLL